MRMMIGTLLIGVALGTPAAAQEPRVLGLTFEQAVALAVERNPSVARAATAIGRAEALLSQARAVTRPSLNARITSATIDNPVEFDGLTVQPRTQVTFSGEASIPILAPARWAARAQAEDQVDVAAASASDVRRQIALASAQAWLMVLGAQRQLGVEEGALETARAHLQYAERLLQAGAGSRLNMIRAAQEVSAGEARLEDARLALRTAQESLGVLVAEDGPADAVGEPSLRVPAAVDEEAWLQARPDVRAQRALVQANERIVRDSWKDVAPAATLSFDPQYLTPSGLFQPSQSWRLSVSVVQPIFLGGLQGAVTAERQSALDAERFALRELELQARSEVRLARATLSSRERTLASITRAADQAAEVLRITTLAFEVGATTNIEVIDAQRSAREAETAAALAQDSLEQARLELLAAIGQFPG